MRTISTAVFAGALLLMCCLSNAVKLPEGIVLRVGTDTMRHTTCMSMMGACDHALLEPASNNTCGPPEHSRDPHAWALQAVIEQPDPFIWLTSIQEDVRKMAPGQESKEVMEREAISLRGAAQVRLRPISFMAAPFK
jgi:hypothetical protein